MPFIKEITIQDIKAIALLKIAAGALTIIRGENGGGKSSIIDAVRTVFEGGHDPGLVRQGAKAGKVTILLDDGSVIEKRITAKDSTVTVKNADGLKVDKPQAFVERLASGFSFDPVAFLRATPKARAAYIAKVMPIRFSDAELRQAIGAVAPSLCVPCDLDRAQAIRKQLFENRTDTQRTVRELDGTVATLTASLPAGTLEDASAVVAEIAADIEAQTKALSDSRAAKAAELARIVAGIKAEAERQIAEIRAEAQKAIEAAPDHVAREWEPQILPLAQGIETLKGALAAAREKQEAVERAKGAMEMLERVKEDVEEKRKKAEQLTAAIGAIDSLVQQKISTSPVPGVTVADGEVFVDGIPFDHVNHAARFTTAFMLADLGAGQAGLMIADDTEHLVGSTWEEFQAAAKASGRQIICARAEEGALKVEVAA